MFQGDFLRGKKAIVTGGTRGLGLCMATALRDAGAKVVIVGSSDKIYSVAESMNEQADKEPTAGIVCDFSQPENIANCVDKAVDILGGVDILINNAGTQIRHPSENFPLEDFQKVINVNLVSAFEMARLCGRHMLKQEYGKIINIASMLSFLGGYTVPAYAASKGGIVQFTKSLANEWSSRGINVNAIAPGYMVTDNTKAIYDDEKRSKEILERIPAERWGQPRDMVGAMFFLCCDYSDYINGVVLPVDGGFLAR